MAEHTKGAELVAPRRRVLLTLKLDADSWKDMADRLRCLARDIDIEGGMGTAGLSAGYSASYTYEASEDPTITHDSWAAALDVYLEALHAREQDAVRASTPTAAVAPSAPPEARVPLEGKKISVKAVAKHVGAGQNKIRATLRAHNVERRGYRNGDHGVTVGRAA